MNSNYIVKVQFEDSLRRLTLGKGELDFSKLEVRTRDLFQIEQTAPLALTYTDKDGDTVTMADDQDLKDALVLQKINPLRLNVVVSGTKGIPAAEKETAAPPTEAKVEKSEEQPASAENAAPVDEVIVPANAGFAPERPIHFGVKCDVCGIMPIKGIRYKSNKEMNYDLCEACFQQSGAPVDDYLKIDRSFDRQRFPFRMGGRGGRGRGRMSFPQRPIPPLGNCCGVGLPPHSGNETQPEAQKEADNAPTAQKTQEGDAKPDSAPAPATGDADAAPAVPSDQPGKDGLEMGARMMRMTPPCTRVGPGLFGQYMWNLGLKKMINEDNAKAQEAEAKDVPAPEGKAASSEEDLTSKEGMLSKLAAMGFTDEKVNTEVLEKNKFDLRKSLDDLCAAEEWDKPLAELQEMGFSDASINRSLMFKYDGNVKKVVRELVQLSKEQSNLGKGVKQA